MRWSRAAAVALSAVVLLSGCTHDSAAPPVSSPFAACPGVASGVPATGAAAGKLVPDLTLACFDGGPGVGLRTLGRPAVLNLFASWCTPCRQELPAMQRLSDSGRVLVLGVVTGDTRAKAADLGTELGVRFPAVFDPDRTLLNRLGRTGLPLTLFVDATGHVAYLHNAAALDDAALAGLVRDKLHVDLP